MNLPAYDQKIGQLFYLLFLVLLTTFGLAILAYGDPFRFWEHAFSILGDTVTTHGYSNTLSRTIFSVGLVLQSLIMFKISSRYTARPGFRNQAIKRWLAFLSGIGFLVAIFPNNLYHTVHSIGVGIVIGVLYFFTMFFHFELKPNVPAKIFYIDIALVQIVIFPYAVAFFVDSIHKQSLQKFCIMGVFFALLRIVSVTDKGFEPRDVIGYLRRWIT